MRKKMILAFLIFQIFACANHQLASVDESKDTEVCSKDIGKRIEKMIRGYRIRISYAEERMCQRLEIFKKGKRVYFEEGIDNHYFLGSKWDDSDGNFTMNLTGNGVQLVISKWTGGAHCCMSFLIFNLKNGFRKIAEIEGGNFEPEIIDLDHDGIPEIQITDDCLAYSFSSFASSAKGTVILKYKNGNYAVSEKLMSRPPPSEKYLRKQIPRWRKKFFRKTPDWPPEEFIQALTDLVFTGHASQASSFVNQIWPQKLPGKTEFLKSYKEAISESRYYSEAAKEIFVE